MPQLPEDYTERVYAGWLGKCIGVRFGAPLENWTYQQIQDYLGEVHAYLPIPEGKIFQPDDDTSVPAILMRAVEDNGAGVTAAQMGQTLLNYLGDQHGSLWWGGYGASTEHTAYLNLKNGIPAPLSGSAQLNGMTVAEQIGGQIFSDIWGLMVPNNPQKAADYAQKAASVTHDRNGVYGGMFIAAMVSAAFSNRDPQEWIRHGLSVIPADCEYARVVNAVSNFYLENPSDWRACYHFIIHHFGYDHYSGIVHIIPNAGVIVMGLLYGAGDFSRSICITNMAGWDTDCNVGNVAAIVGTAVGLSGIESRWRDPQNDSFVAASVVGTANLLDIPAVVDRLVRCGQQIAGETLLPQQARCHFSYPGSTHGFLHWGEQRNILVLRQAEYAGRGTLRGIVRLLKKKQDMGIYVETYLEPKQLSSAYYGAGLSPTIYPGQRVTARLQIPDGAPQSILAGLYVYDNASKQRFQGGSVLLQPGKWQELTWTIPAIPNARLAQVGVIFRNIAADTWKGEFYLDELDWGGIPQLDYNFAGWPMQYGAAAQWTYLRGFWRVEEGAYHGSGNEISETYLGELTWQDLSLQARLTPLYGDTHCVLVRVQGALQCYAAGVTTGKLVLYKKVNGSYREVAAQPFDWQHGQSLELRVDVIKNRLRVHLPAADIHLDWQDELQPYLNGMLGLAAFANCHTSFEEIHVC
jgi:ADP-ribosylglycohydrolase